MSIWAGLVEQFTLKPKWTDSSQQDNRGRPYRHGAPGRRASDLMVQLELRLPFSWPNPNVEFTRPAPRGYDRPIFRPLFSRAIWIGFIDRAAGGSGGAVPLSNIWQLKFFLCFLPTVPTVQKRNWRPPADVGTHIAHRIEAELLEGGNGTQAACCRAWTGLYRCARLETSMDHGLRSVGS